MTKKIAFIVPGCGKTPRGKAYRQNCFACRNLIKQISK